MESAGYDCREISLDETGYGCPTNREKDGDECDDWYFPREFPFSQNTCVRNGMHSNAKKGAQAAVWRAVSNKIQQDFSITTGAKYVLVAALY